jgi:predicted small lipoprotein YifL
MMRRLLIALLVLGLLVPLAACGRKGSLERPPGSTYPHEYPAE